MHKHVTHSEDSGKGIRGDNWPELKQDEDTGAVSKDDRTKERGISKANHDDNSNHVFK